MSEKYYRTNPRDGREYYFPTMDDLTMNTGLTRDELIDRVLTMHVRVADELGVTAEKVKDAMVSMAEVDLATLFALVKVRRGYRPNRSVVYAEKAYYKEEFKEGRVTPAYFDVLVMESTYVGRETAKVARAVLEEAMPELLLDGRFFDTVPRFPDKSIMGISPSMPLDGIQTYFARYGSGAACQYTVGDLLDAMTSEHPEDMVKKVSKIDIYASGGISVFVGTGEKKGRFNNSIALPPKAIMNADWAMVEDYKVADFGMVGGRFTESHRMVRQCELECFDEPIVGEVRKAFAAARERKEACNAAD